MNKEQIIEELKSTSNKYLVLDGCYVVPKTVLDIFVEHLESHQTQRILLF